MLNIKGEIIKLDVSKYVSDADFVIDIIERHMEKKQSQYESGSHCGCRWLWNGI